MHIKVDEDLPPVVADWLRERGYEASTVVDQAMGGWQDDALWTAVQQDGQFLLTADKGFGDIRRYPPGTHPGILLLRPSEDGIRPLLELLDKTLAEIDLNRLARTISVATPRGLRVRRA